MRDVLDHLLIVATAIVLVIIVFGVGQVIGW